MRRSVNPRSRRPKAVLATERETRAPRRTQPIGSIAWRQLALLGVALLFSQACGGKVDGAADAGGAGGSTGNVQTFSCTVQETQYDYSWCVLAAFDGSCPGGEKGSSCAGNFVARCTYADIVIHYYNIDSQQSVEIRQACEKEDAVFSEP